MSSSHNAHVTVARGCGCGCVLYNPYCRHELSNPQAPSGTQPRARDARRFCLHQSKQIHRNLADYVTAPLCSSSLFSSAPPIATVRIS